MIDYIAYVVSIINAIFLQLTVKNSIKHTEIMQQALVTYW